MSSNRKRSGAVRSAAQAHLAALREERIAKRRAARAILADKPAVSHIPPEDAVLVIAPEDLETDVLDGVDADVPAEVSVEDHTAAPEAENEFQDDGIAVLPGQDHAPDQESEASDDDASEAIEPEAADDATEAPSEDEAAQPASSDLVALPGIGPGLIWMLQSAGVHSLKDMADADASSLGAKLGLVGELLDLDHWIAAAAELAPHEDPR